MKGLVIKSTGSWYAVKTNEHLIFQCRVRGKLKLKGMKVTNPIAVGDLVYFDPDGEGQGIIREIEPRKNYLIRRSTRKSAFGHILASNLDQVVVIATLSFPRTSLGFIDRVLVAADSFRIPSLLVYNKSDRWNDEDKSQLHDLKKIYESLKVEFITVSAIEEKNILPLKKNLSAKTSLLVGHSGVGKSTLLNKLVPGLEQKTSEVSTFANKGTHTTTFAEMFEIDKETFVIDTPGIKELGLIDIYDEEISHFFPEMRALLGACKYHNCTHLHEPGCAVINAVENGQISMSRFQSYMSMMEGIDSFR